MRRVHALLAVAALAASATPAVAAVAPTALPATAQVDSRLAEELADAAPAEDIEVYVHAATIDAARRAAEGAGLDVLASFDRVGVVAAHGPAAKVLGAARGATYLEAVQHVEADMITSLEAVRRHDADATYKDAAGGSFDGSGQTIGIIDSGVDGTHPMFQVGGESKVVRNLKSSCATRGEVLKVCQASGPEAAYENRDLFFTDVPTNDSDTLVANGHGTHVASTAAGVDSLTSDGRKVGGVATGAKVVAISVGQPSVPGVSPVPGVGVLGYAMASGLHWALDHHDAPCGAGVSVADCPPMRVVSLSLSAPRGDYDPNGVIAKLQDALVAEGVVVVWSAGNFGTDPEEQDRTTISQVHQWKQSPTPGVITAASYFDGNTGTREGAISGFSSKGRIGDVATYPDLAAPGEDITAACRAWLPICSTGLDGIPDPDYNTISGTSMAAPHVAGAVARLFHANPALTPADVEDILEDTAHKFASGDAYEPDLPERNADGTTSADKGHGLLDIASATAAALGLTDPGVPDPCAAGGPLVTDNEGDAIALLGFPTPLPNEEAIDIVSSDISWDDAAGAMTVTIEVADLPEIPGGTTGTGEYADWEFVHAGQALYISVNRALDVGEVFNLGRFATTRQTLARGLQGRFDPATDTITVVLSNADLGRVDPAVAEIPTLDAGDVISGVEITSRRDVGVIVPDADVAAARCPRTLG